MVDLNQQDKVVVFATSFIKNETLCSELKKAFPNAQFLYLGISDEERKKALISAKAIICGREKIDDAFLGELPNLKIISKYGVGLDNIDFEACRKAQIEVLWTPGVNKRCVAELALGFMIALFHNVPATSTALKNGVWHKSGGLNLTGKKIGILGLGNVGTDLLDLLAPFGVSVLGCDIVEKNELLAKHSHLSLVSFEGLISQSDLISIHTPLTPKTLDLFEKATFSKMKNGAFLVNTARGKIVNENDLVDAIGSGQIGGAALDVFGEEPLIDSKLSLDGRILITPHIAGNSREAVLAMGLAAIENLTNQARR